MLGTLVNSVGTTAETLVRTARVARRVAAVGSPHWRSGARFHVALEPGVDGAERQRAIRTVVGRLLDHPDVLTAYWDGGLARLVVRATEDAVADRVLDRAVELLAEHGLSGSPEGQPEENAEPSEAQDEVQDEAQDAAPGAESEAAHPGDPQDVRLALSALALDSAALGVALAGRVLRLPRGPQVVTAAATLVREDPRLRRAAGSRLGAGPARLALAAAGAVAYGMDQSPVDLLLDAGLRTVELAEGAARLLAFERLHEELCLPERADAETMPRLRREPPADAEAEFAEKASTAGEFGALGAVLLSGGLGKAAGAVLAGSPRAARFGGSAFRAGLGCLLAREDVLIRSPERLRLLSSVDTVVLHSSALRTDERVLVEAEAEHRDWDRERLWSAVQEELAGRRRRGARIWLHPQPGAPSAEVGPMTAARHEQDLGTVRIEYRPDPLAEAVLDAARRAGLRIVVAGEPALGPNAALVDEVAPVERSLAEVVGELQEEGRVVLTVARPVDGLLSGDLTVGVLDGGSSVPWAADLLCCRGLAGVWRLLVGVRVARGADRKAQTYARAGAALSALILVTHRQRAWTRWLFTNAHNAPPAVATLLSALSGLRSAAEVAAAGPPQEHPWVPWHALSPGAVADRLREAPPTEQSESANGPVAVVGWARAAGRTVAALPGMGPARTAGRLIASVRAELHDPLTPVLAVGAGASAVVGSVVDAVLVALAMATNALVTGVQRLRAEQALAGLREEQRQKARTVDADGDTHLVDAARLALGDRIALEVGDVVPADARLVEAVDLEVDESALTGESVPAVKQTGATPGAALGDRLCMVFQGTTVVAGQGRAVVVGTGRHTEAGRAVALAARSAPEVGVQARLQQLTRRALPLTLAGGAAVAGLSLLRGRPAREAIGSGVAVAVAAVPEGLPLVATVAQTAAARRLGRRGVLVRSVRTLEALGRVDTVCFDKTGTLTRNRLSVVRVTTADGAAHRPEEPESAEVLQHAAHACPLDGNGDGEARHAHATDDAVLSAAESGAADEDWKQLDGRPFEAGRGYASAVGQVDGHRLLVAKGAPEVVLAHCQDAGSAAESAAEELAGDGWRVLAVALRRGRAAGEVPESLPEDLPEDLEFAGFVALADVERESAGRTVDGLRSAGLRPVMLTGDHPRTARAIARSLGWPEEAGVVTGDELSALDRAGRARALRSAGVVARVAPDQKLLVIEALQEAGRTVAMVGDGANDAAAIRAADVGIGLAGSGSAAARSAADLVLTRGELTALVAAVHEARQLWRSVVDAIGILLGGNAGEVAFSAVGTLLGGRSPLSTRQVLLVNLLTDLFPAMAVAVTPRDAPASEATDCGTAALGAPLTREIRRRGTVTALSAGTAWAIGGLTPGTARRTSTMALCAVVGAQLVQTLTRRRHGPLVVATCLGSAALLVAIVQTPGVSHFFGCTPLGPVGWAGVAVALAVAAGADLPLARFARRSGGGG